MTRLQEILIQKISATKDEKILQEINRLLEDGIEEDVYQLTPEQISGIEESKEKIRNGQFLNHEDARKEIEEWLKSR